MRVFCVDTAYVYEADLIHSSALQQVYSIKIGMYTNIYLST